MRSACSVLGGKDKKVLVFSLIYPRCCSIQFRAACLRLFCAPMLVLVFLFFFSLVWCVRRHGWALRIFQRSPLRKMFYKNVCCYGLFFTRPVRHAPHTHWYTAFAVWPEPPSRLITTFVGNFTLEVCPETHSSFVSRSLRETISRKSRLWRDWLLRTFQRHG